MNNPLLHFNSLIKKEADEMLFEKGLFSILRSFGIPHISGSYALISETDFFLLGSKIVPAFNPVKMSFRNERIGKSKGLPNGLYWGIYLGNERAGAWKIDIWAVDTKECQRLLNYCADIKEKLSPLKSLYILGIKSQCWKDPEYRRSYTSMDIYTAVLNKGITTIEAFKEYQKTLI
jgi:hypothetical protein